MAAPDPKIDQQLADIAAMEAAFQQSSCESQDPFVRYPSKDSGVPPTINFNVPQSTAFTTYGKLAKYIDPTWFRPFTRNVPMYNFFNYVNTLTPNAVQQLFHPNVMANPVVGQFTPFNMGVPAFNQGPLPHAPVANVNTAAALSAHTAGQLAAQPHAVVGSYAQPVATPVPPRFAPLPDFAQQGIRGLYTHRIMNGGALVRYIAKPPFPVPRIVVIEEYTTESFLGDYGAGRVVKTFTLLPGEKTTLSVRTFKDQVSTASASENMLDSFSSSSATELDNMMQQEMGNSYSQSAQDGGNDTSYNTYSNSHNSSSAWNVSANINLFDVASIGGGYGQSTADTSTSSGGFANTYNYSSSSARAGNIDTLQNALNKSVQQSNANRQIDVNHTTSSSSENEEEDVTVREIQNVNLSRVLNFTFRQLLQQYTTITYLSGLKFAYTNGYTESNTVVNLSHLPNMLKDIIEEDHIDDVMCLLLKPYCNVLNYEDVPIPFIEAITNTIGGCLTAHFVGCTTEVETIWRKKKGITDGYPSTNPRYKVPGVILSVSNQTLFTDSMIGDALLGAGEALDCFNQKAQDASTMADYIRNLRAMQGLEDSIQTSANNQLFATQQLSAGDQKIDMGTQQEAVIQALIDAGDPVATASLYKKVYGDCCDVPQNTDNGGCGCS